jgi:hypothetical protein
MMKEIIPFPAAADGGNSPPQMLFAPAVDAPGTSVYALLVFFFALTPQHRFQLLGESHMYHGIALVSVHWR